MRSLKNQSFLTRLRYAGAGLVIGLRTEHSVQFQILAMLAIFTALVFLRPEPVWWALVALASAAVIAAELFNTAVEHLADHLHPDLHPQIRVVKDCAAAAVLIASLGALAVAAALGVHLFKTGPP
jgi:diacylglycerol kinase (ATP)